VEGVKYGEESLDIRRGKNNKNFRRMREVERKKNVGREGCGEEM
jgi:hypothetical protein